MPINASIGVLKIVNYKADEEIDIDEEFQIPDDLIGQRIDASLAALLPRLSRSRIKRLIDNQQILINGKSCKPKSIVLGNERVVISDPAIEADVGFVAENIPLDVVYEDDTILVINKKHGVVVHPGAGNWTGTVLNGLLHRYPDSKNIPRAGIVHRLDKDTTGLMVVARTIEAQIHLVKQLQERSIKREYIAVVYGKTKASGTIDLPIGRHPRARTKMAVIASGKEAKTHFQKQSGGEAWSSLQCFLETGRTHQIRVHLSHIGHSLIGDPVYKKNTSNLDQIATIDIPARQALHAKKLTLIHPDSGQEISIETDTPEDLARLEQSLKNLDAQRA